MPDSSFLPHLPLPASPLALFGLLLIAGMAGGELVRRVLRAPRIVGYVLTGMLLGAGGLVDLRRYRPRSHPL
jgi:Kef-type K+ transport system membrane component KefB